MVDEKFTFFWDGVFSQWYPSEFTINGIRYNCAEQWMMASKARLFGDKDSEKAIMKASHPRDQKALGRKVKNFNQKQWELVARHIVYTGNQAKFGQNLDLKRALLKTEGTTLVEASPLDTVWGIGLDKKDKRAKSRETWRGTNWLGEVLTNLREEILKRMNK
jgi:ribA/ribD-fused uncharacterized protein